jgi:hypothetical protein
MSADKIEVGFLDSPFGLAVGIPDFAEKETHSFACGEIESMRKQIGFYLFVRGKAAFRIAREHMDFMPSFAELMAEVISHSPGSADGVREENICQH